MTSYVTLKRDVGEDRERQLWVQGPTVEAVSAEAAVRKAVDEKGGTYVAVPLRSFQELTVTVEMKRTLRLA